MGVSFKISKVGTRFKPKLLQIEDSGNENDGSVAEPLQNTSTAEVDYTRIGGNVANNANVIVNSGLYSALEDLEASFSLNLFPDGFSVGKITEVFNDLPTELHPYDRASKTFFSAIEYGWIPGDILDDLPCKYTNGAVLCEVHDYRKCLSSKTDSGSAENSPLIHKVTLKMSMENVVKDLLSLSDDSWTYRDLLEAESYILKALQPVLHLNPQLGQDRNPPAKKLDLEITWSWKKREMKPSQATNSVSNNLCDVTSILGTNYDRGDSSLEQLSSSSNPNLLQKNDILSTASLSNPLASESTCPIADRYDQPVLNYSTTPTNVVSETWQVVANTSDPRKASFSGVGENAGCITQATEGHFLKRPKIEPVELNPDSEFQWSNNMLHRQAMADKFQYERSIFKSGLLLSQGNNQQVVLKDMPKLHAGMSLTKKQESVETSNLASSDVEKKNDKDTEMYQRSNQSNHRQPYMQYPFPSIRANTPTNAPSNQMDQHLVKKSRKNSGAQKRKHLENAQVSIGARNESASYCHNEVIESDASGPAKRPKKNSPPKGCKVVDSVDCTSNFDPLIERFMKIKVTTQRHGLDKQKCKLDHPLQKKAVFPTTLLIALHLLNCNDNQDSRQTRTSTFIKHPRDGISEIDCEDRVKLVISEQLNETMVKTSVLYQPTKETESIDVPIIPSFPSIVFTDLFAAQFKSLMVREGYSLGNDQIEPTLPNSVGSSSNNEPSVPSSGIPEVKTDGQLLPIQSLVMQSSADMSTCHANPLSHDVYPGRFLVPPESTLQLSDNPIIQSQLGLSAKGKSIQTRNPRSKSQLRITGKKGRPKKSPNPLLKPQLDIADEGKSMQSRNRPFSISQHDHISGKGYSNPLSEPKLDIATKGGPMQAYNPLPKSQLELDIVSKGNPMQSYNPPSTSWLHIADKGNYEESSWQQILSRRAHLEFQMQQRMREQEQIMQRKAMLGRLDPAACDFGRLPFGQGFGNISVASFSGLMGTASSMPSFLGGQVPWIANMGQLNNLVNTTDNNHFSSYDASFDDPTRSQGSGLPHGVGVPTNTGAVPMQTPNVFDMTCNQQMQVGEAMNSMFQSPEAGFLLEHVVSSPPTPSQGRFPYQQASAMGGLEVSSGTHASVGSSSNAHSNITKGGYI